MSFILTAILQSLFQVRITLQSVDIEKSNGCAKDSLKFYDGKNLENISSHIIAFGYGYILA